MENKKWWESKTVWFNLLSGILAILATVKGASLGLPDWGIALIDSGVAVGNIWLRFVSSVPLERKLL